MRIGSRGQQGISTSIIIVAAVILILLLLAGAVVVGAIVLLIFMPFNGPPYIVPDPLMTMGMELNKVKRGGVASISSSVVQFGAGQEYHADAVSAEAGMGRDRALFCCKGADYGSDDSSAKCDGYEFNGEGPPPGTFSCSEAGKMIAVNKAISGKAMAYCPIGSGKCAIGFKPSRG